MCAAVQRVREAKAANRLRRKALDQASKQVTPISCLGVSQGFAQHSAGTGMMVVIPGARQMLAPQDPLP